VYGTNELVDHFTTKEEDQHLLWNLISESKSSVLLNDVYYRTIQRIELPLRLKIREQILQGVQVANVLRICIRLPHT
jgi:hypothetical protein